MIEFDAELELDGKTATGITVPPSVLDALDSGKRPRVRVTINAHTYQSSASRTLKERSCRRHHP